MTSVCPTCGDLTPKDELWGNQWCQTCWEKACAQEWWEKQEWWNCSAFDSLRACVGYWTTEQQTTVPLDEAVDTWIENTMELSGTMNAKEMEAVYALLVDDDCNA